ncbi:hypothetical protein [Streptomyces mayteni]
MTSRAARSAAVYAALTASHRFADYPVNAVPPMTTRSHVSVAVA